MENLREINLLAALKSLPQGLSHGQHQEMAVALIRQYGRQREMEALVGFVPNSTALMFILGWQGGTIHQLSKELGVPTGSILGANEEQIGTLMRMAQKRALQNEAARIILQAHGTTK